MKKTYDSLPEVIIKSKKILKQLLNEHIKAMHDILRNYKLQLEHKMEEGYKLIKNNSDTAYTQI